MKQTTLCLLVKENEICLAMKKRGFGIDKWNGYGGKIEAGETVERAAVREIKEEIGVEVDESNLQLAAKFIFYFPYKPEWDHNVVVFLIRKWQGEPIETEEMRPQWFGFDQIPFESMWPDDRIWLPEVLAGKKLEGEWYFAENGSDFEKYTLIEI